MLTRFGDDMFGRQLFEALTANGVDPSLITVDPTEPTGASTVFAAEGDYSSIIVSGAAGKMSPADIDAARGAIQSAAALVLQLELPFALSAHAAGIARAAGKHVILNASPAPGKLSDLPRELLRAVSVVVVNGFEAGKLLGRELTPSDAARELAKALAVKACVVTAGASGSAAWQDGVVVFQPSFFVKVVDAVGAGDAFLGAFVAGMVAGLPLNAIMKRAAAAGAIAVSRAGSTFVTSEEIDRFMG
jgi:ribokinase